MEINEEKIEKAVIAICTYRRPNQLRNAIRTVGELHIPSGLNVRLIVIDNCPSQDSKKVFVEEEQNLHIPAFYVTEEQRGIVFARNNALRYSLKNEFDFLAFFDDDDYPDKEWLSSLWSSIKKYSATVVSGRMKYKWPNTCNLNEEVKRVYDNALGEIETGTIRKKCGSGNTLIRMDFIKNHQLSFHPRFNLTGGEDSHFFEQMTLLGAKIIWCNEAVVHSTIDPARTTEDFIFKRRYNVGYTRHMSDSLLFGKAKAFWKSLYYCIDIGIRCFFDAFRKSEKSKVRTKRRLSEARGRIDSILGKTFESYTYTDGN